MQSSSGPGVKQTLLLIVFAFATLIAMLTYLSMEMMTVGSGPGGVFGYVLGATAIVGGVIFSVVRLKPNSGLSLTVFQQKMMISLFLAELGTLIGFVWRMKTGISLFPLAGGSEAVILLVILPKTLAFLRSN